MTYSDDEVSNYDGPIIDSDDEETLICPISHDEIEVRHDLICGHVFEKEYILDWLRNHRTCPMCRRIVRDENPNHGPHHIHITNDVEINHFLEMHGHDLTGQGGYAMLDQNFIYMSRYYRVIGETPTQWRCAEFVPNRLRTQIYTQDYKTYRHLKLDPSVRSRNISKRQVVTYFEPRSPIHLFAEV